MKKQFTLLLLFISVCIKAQNLGINNPSPEAALDIYGDLALKSAFITADDGVNAALNIGINRFSNYKLNGPTANFSIAGMTGGVDGRLVTIHNRSGFSMELLNDDAGAVGAHRIATSSNANVTVYNNGNVTFQYDGAIQRWQVISTNYSSVFNAGGGGTNWTLSGNNISNSNTGNVGIGVNNPNAKLAIVGTAPNGSLAISGSTHTSHFNYPTGDLENVYIRGGKALSHILLNDIAGLGNVGIGVSNPASKLEVNGKVGVFGTALTNNVNFGLLGGGISILNTNGNGQTLSIDGSNLQSSSVSISGNTSMRPMVLNPFGGNVGVGTNFTPEYKLHLYATGEQLMKIDGSNSLVLFHDRISNAQYGFLRAWTNNPFNPAGYYGLEIGVPPAGNDPIKRLMFSTNYNLRMVIMEDGNVGIGTINPGNYKLAVNGIIRAKEIRVNTGWADYVFEDDYQLKSLEEVEKYVKENKHLPNIPTAEELQRDGVNISELQTKMMAKIEELTLYLIEANKKISNLETLVKSKKQ